MKMCVGSIFLESERTRNESPGTCAYRSTGLSWLIYHVLLTYLQPKALMTQTNKIGFAEESGKIGLFRRVELQ